MCELVQGHREEDILPIWAQHFQDLATSKRQSNPKKCKVHLTETFNNRNLDLEDPLTPDEIVQALKRLKRGKAGGRDNLSPEHLKFGGSVLQKWLLKVLQAIVHLEQIPASFTSGITIPVYKGKGKDPLSMNSYRGLALMFSVCTFGETPANTRRQWYSTYKPNWFHKRVIMY